MTLSGSLRATCEQLVALERAFVADVAHHERVVVALSDGAPLQVLLLVLWATLATLRCVVCRRSESLRRARAAALLLLAASLVLAVPLVKRALLPWLVGRDGARRVANSVERATRVALQRGRTVAAHTETALAPWLVAARDVRRLDGVAAQHVNDAALRTVAALLCGSAARRRPEPTAVDDGGGGASAAMRAGDRTSTAVLCETVRDSGALVQAVHELAFLATRFAVVGTADGADESFFDALATVMMRRTTAAAAAVVVVVVGVAANMRRQTSCIIPIASKHLPMYCCVFCRLQKESL